jgi:phthalate 4,5-dioxygenase
VIQEENELLTRTGPGTPCGELMRRYWQPAALSEELPPDGAPLPVTLFGEELVLFRDDLGRLGLLGLHCAHRGADLSYGRLEDGGLRCIYHGWLYDIHGKIIDMPGEVHGGASFRDSICHKAYPVEQRAGVIFAYMGPGEPPQLPNFGFFSVPENNVSATKLFHDCNYLQANEGNIDLLHVSFLHSSDKDRQPAVIAPEPGKLSGRGSAPISETVEADLTDVGLRVCKIRFLSPQKNYLRVLEFILPNACAAPARQEEGMGYLVNWHVPIDDKRHWKYMFLFNWEHPLDKEMIRRDRFNFGMTEDYRCVLNKKNRYLQDRESMKRTSYSGLGYNFQAQDLCITEGIGLIQDRTKEHLAPSDAPVVVSRKVLMNAIKTVLDGGDPPHMKVDPKLHRRRRIVSIYGTFPASVNWKEYCRELEFAHDEREESGQDR